MNEIKIGQVWKREADHQRVRVTRYASGRVVYRYLEHPATGNVDESFFQERFVLASCSD